MVDDDPVAGLEAGAVEPATAQADAGFDVLCGEVADGFNLEGAWDHGAIGAMALGSGFPDLDFNLVAVRKELGAEAEGFALQG